MEYEIPKYIGNKEPNYEYHHGKIPPVRGVKCYQITRANRNYKDYDDGTGYTYKHGADLAYFNGRFYVQYLANPKDEHAGAGISVLASSKDGVSWEDFKISFPTYKIKAMECTDYKGITHSFDGTSYAFMHQRMSFYRASNGRMLLLGFYGWSEEKWRTNWDNYGIGRVVRELYGDGNLGKIYFIRNNKQSGIKEEDLNYPLFTKSGDDEFIETCNELLDNKLYVQQWAEENGDIDPIITLKHPMNGYYEAFSWYSLKDNSIVGLWKHSLFARSFDLGSSWSDVAKSNSFVMSGQKVWGQETSDGNYAIIYVPSLFSTHRWPMCIVTSSDGIHFDNMGLICGEVPPMRYEGFWKDFGPQYMRGLLKGITTKEDSFGEDVYLTYSVNKEDIWFASIPVPIKHYETEAICDTFIEENSLRNWNLYKPKWANFEIALNPYGKGLRISNREPVDYASCERLLMAEGNKKLSFGLIIYQEESDFYIEICDGIATIAARLIVEQDKLYVSTVTRYFLCKLNVGIQYHIEVLLSIKNYSFTISVIENNIDLNDSKKKYSYMHPVKIIERIIFRTGARRKFPHLDCNPEEVLDLPDADVAANPKIYDICYLKEETYVGVESN